MKHWNQDEIKKFMSMVRDGKSPTMISKSLRRPMSSINHRFNVLFIVEKLVEKGKIQKGSEQYFNALQMSDKTLRPYLRTRKIFA